MSAMGLRALEGRTLAGIARVYFFQEDYATSLDYDQQALVVSQQVGDQFEVPLVHTFRGLTYERLKRFDEAIAAYEAASAAIENVLNAAVLESAVAGLAGRIENTAPFYAASALLVGKGKLEDALTYAERGRGILIRADLTGKPIDFRAGLDKSLIDREAALRLAIGNAQQALDALTSDISA